MPASKAPAPFSCKYTPNIPELLAQLNCTLVLSTYQAGKLIFLSANEEEKLIQLPRNFKRVMGVGIKDNKMVLAQRDEVLVLANSPELARFYPIKPQTYDAMYFPRAAYFTGLLDIHDIDLGANNEILAVNTSFSCLIKVDSNYSFTPIWKPPFISKIASEDRCHLNGMAMVDDRPKYVTAFSETDTPQGWRESVTKGGVLIDVESDELISRNLPMPHSPRMIEAQLIVLLSATGEIATIDIDNGKVEVINKLNGFVRGLAYYNDYLFVGLSKLRKNSSTFAHLDIAKEAKDAGIAIIHFPTGAYVGEIKYEASVDEIYDVQVLPGVRRGNILNTMNDTYTKALMSPEATYWGRIQEKL